VIAAVAGNLALLLGASVLLGSANAALFLTRYAAAEIGGARAGGRALGLVLLTTSIGAVASPLLLGPAGLRGIYAIAGAAFLVAALTLSRLPRRRPTAGPPWRAQLRGALAAPARYGVAVLAGANLVMVGVMAIAPVHLMADGHTLDAIGTMISLHVAGMFAPSALSGWLADRVGPAAVAASGCVLAVVAAAASAAGGIGAFSLVVLGVGWNFGVVGGSTLIAQSVDASLAPSVEGIGEVAMGVAAAAAAPLAGMVLG
jgi:hypothetical protein